MTTPPFGQYFRQVNTQSTAQSWHTDLLTPASLEISINFTSGIQSAQWHMFSVSNALRNIGNLVNHILSCIEHS